MAIRIPFGIDPNERWEVDFCAAAARSQLELQRAIVKGLEETTAAEKDPERRSAFEAQVQKARGDLARVEAELAEYTPESGPVFSLAAIPGARRAELAGRHQEIEAMPVGKAQSLARAEWAEDVLRLTIRGHRNLRTRSGREVPYVAGEGGRPDGATLDAYGAILVDLAWVALSAQRLGADGKNA